MSAAAHWAALAARQIAEKKEAPVPAELATTTFGPLDKYIPANDNVPQDESGASAGFSAGEYLTREEFEREANLLGGHVVPPRPAFQERGQYIGLRRSTYATQAVGGYDVPPHLHEAFAELVRYGDFMQTATGRKFWPMSPRADEVFIEDIAHALSLQCRYAGHCLRFYSVAEHSVLMARHLRWEGVDVALWALLHDASEAYLVDVPRPVKPYLDGYKEAEAKVMSVICQRFGLADEMPAIVHDADNRIIGDELANLVPMDWHARYAGEELGVELKYWSPEKASEEFMATFEALMDCRTRGMA